jgi:hypothetical protein
MEWGFCVGLIGVKFWTRLRLATCVTMSKVFSRRIGIQSLASYVCIYVSEKTIVIVKILNMHNIDMYL